MSKPPVCIYIDTLTLAHNRNRPPEEQLPAIIVNHAEFPAFRVFEIDVKGSAKLRYDRERCSRREQPVLWIEADEADLRLPDGVTWREGYKGA